ncbi:hypothetical protein ACIBK9_04215 [Nonomuraea sp. NPDC050227]|uniref:hypothetical protein n=1 Tax=Nonomuraea sp. NPDC050227 TaxID=3364360 RepID=UPI00379AEF08
MWIPQSRHLNRQLLGWEFLADAATPKNAADALTVRALGNAAFILAAVVTAFDLIFQQELSTHALLGTLIFAGIGVGLRIEAAIRLRD